jgi:hypothetical protein
MVNVLLYVIRHLSRDLTVGLAYFEALLDARNSLRFLGVIDACNLRM